MSKNKGQDNLRGFRGLLRREISRTREEARNEKEKQNLLNNTDNIKIECWRGNHDKNKLMFIRLNFEKELIPNDFIPDLKMMLGELFHGYL